MEIFQNLMQRNHTAMERGSGDIEWIVIHYVGALGDAWANTEYYKNYDVGASADFWVGHNGDIWQGNDYRHYYSWHSGGGLQGDQGHTYYGICTNRNSVAIEMCVKKYSTLTMNATDRDWYFTEATVNSAAWLTASLMRELNIGLDHVIRHYDVVGKICPNPFVYDNGAVTWAGFKQKTAAWYAEMAGQGDEGEVSDQVRVDIENLRIRSGPGTNYPSIGYTGIGSFGITEEADGQGASRWGKLKSGAGWISLDYTTRL